MDTFYVVGYPGAGKTSATREAIRQLGWEITAIGHAPLARIFYDSGAIQLGSAREEMGGTDGLSMSIGPTAIDWVLTEPTPTLIAEGDRLAYAGFLDACDSVGHLELIFLDINPSLARERTLARNEKAQNASWVKGRVKKVDNLIARRRHTRINADAPVEIVGAQIASLVVRAARRGVLGQSRDAL